MGLSINSVKMIMADFCFLMPAIEVDTRYFFWVPKLFIDGCTTWEIN